MGEGDRGRGGSRAARRRSFAERAALGEWGGAAEKPGADCCSSSRVSAALFFFHFVEVDASRLTLLRHVKVVAADASATRARLVRRYGTLGSLHTHELHPPNSTPAKKGLHSFKRGRRRRRRQARLWCGTARVRVVWWPLKGVSTLSEAGAWWKRSRHRVPGGPVAPLFLGGRSTRSLHDGGSVRRGVFETPCTMTNLSEARAPSCAVLSPSALPHMRLPPPVSPSVLPPYGVGGGGGEGLQQHVGIHHSSPLSRS